MLTGIENFPGKGNSMTIHFIMFFKQMPHRVEPIGIAHIRDQFLFVSNHHPNQFIVSF